MACKRRRARLTIWHVVECRLKLPEWHRNQSRTRRLPGHCSTQYRWGWVLLHAEQPLPVLALDNLSIQYIVCAATQTRN